MAILFRGFHPSDDNASDRARRIIGVLTLMLIAALLAVWGVWYLRPDDTLAKIQRTGVIHIGYAVEGGYSFLDEKGRVSGADPEVARYVARQLGISHVEWHLLDFNDLIAGLESRQFDVIAAGMFITPERQRRVAFSTPTFAVRSALLVEKGNPHHLHSYNDIRGDRSVRVGVLSGSVEEADLVALGVDPERLVRVPDARSGQLLIESKQIDALALSSPTLSWVVRKGDVDGAELAAPFERGGSLSRAGEPAFAFRKEDVRLRMAWDRKLKNFIGSKEHLKMVEPFGFSEKDLPPGSRKSDGTTPQLPK